MTNQTGSARSGLETVEGRASPRLRRRALTLAAAVAVAVTVAVSAAGDAAPDLSRGDEAAAARWSGSADQYESAQAAVAVAGLTRGQVAWATRLTALAEYYAMLEPARPQAAVLSPAEAERWKAQERAWVGRLPDGA